LHKDKSQHLAVVLLIKF